MLLLLALMFSFAPVLVFGTFWGRTALPPLISPLAGAAVGAAGVAAAGAGAAAAAGCARGESPRQHAKRVLAALQDLQLPIFISGGGAVVMVRA